MAWNIGNQKVKKYKDYNGIIKDLSGELDDVAARITLTKFLKTNIGFTFKLLSGIELMPIQEIILKALFERENALVVAARGLGKSYLIAIFSILYSIFYPDRKICLISANFRSSRRILETAEKIAKSKKAELLRQCFPNELKRSTDIYRWVLGNGSEVFALPLSTGQGLRGTRANCVLVDEGLLISREIQDVILRPFLTVRQDFREEAEIRAIENELIANKQLEEEDRISFPKNKYLVFSSASYEFEYLYELYENWIDLIYHPDKIETDNTENPPTYFVVRASYESLPQNGIMDMAQINSAKANGGENTEYFKREYRALFSKSGDGYFNAKKMFECTVPLGQYPTVQLKGEKDYQYILSIDPSYSASKSSDYFAMGVYLLVPQERKLILVHSYGKAGGDIREHYEYLTYLLSFFNIVFIIIDNSGSEFLTGYNESVYAKERNLNLKFLDVDFASDNYLEELNKAQRQYNQFNSKIVYGQNFVTQTIRQMNEHLQNQIDSKKVWFAASLGANETEVKKFEDFKFPFVFKNKNDEQMLLYDFIADQDSWITATKNQTALIEVKTTVLGSLQFDLPLNLRRDTGPNRARKDHYSCLLLATWGARCYYDMLFSSVEKTETTFEPVIIR